MAYKAYYFIPFLGVTYFFPRIRGELYSTNEKITDIHSSLFNGTVFVTSTRKA